ncbi:MAG: glycosyltransferase family 1 protein [Acidobacteriota bacterium]
MRVAIDATPLLLRSAGVKNHLYHWIVHLRRLAGEGAVVTFPLRAPLGELSHERSVWGSAATLAGLARLHLTNYSPLPLADWLGPKADVFHASQQLWNPPRRTPVTATLYDMTCWLMPEMHTPANVAAARRFAERVVKRAAGLLAISESTRADAIRLLGLPPERIDVVYPGVADGFFAVTGDAVRAARQKYALARPYVLFVGTVEPRKNLPVLLDAFARLAPATREQHELVVAGPLGWADRATAARLRAAAGGVRYLGYVPEPDLPGITAGAAVLAYPSLYEGFGFPVAQAMAAGVAVLTSNVSSLPEVAGDAALLVDPRSVEEIRAALERLLGSPDLRARLGAAGVRRAQSFRWEACARASLRFFEKVAGKEIR